MAHIINAQTFHAAGIGINDFELKTIRMRNNFASLWNSASQRKDETTKRIDIFLLIVSSKLSS